MKKLFSLLLLLGAARCAGQDTILLRHANGNPALSGPCTFFVNPYFADELTRATYFGGRSGALQRGPFTSHYDFGNGRLNVPDADVPDQNAIGDKSFVNLFGLGFSCNGHVTLYFSDGRKQAEVMMNGGVPSGPYIEYFPEGTVAIRCILDRGMPSGVWTRYYKSGAAYASGRFRPAPAKYLQDAWHGMLNRKGAENWEEKMGWIKPRRFTEWGLREQHGDERFALQSLLYEFDVLVRALPLHAVPIGAFFFKRRDGLPKAEIFFDTSGIRSGIWTLWKSEGKVRARLEYAPSGELTHVTDTTGKRRTVAEYTARWKAAEERERARRAKMPVTGIVEAATAPDINGIDPGIRRPAVPGAGRSPSDIYNVVEQQPEFPGDARAYLAAQIKPLPGCEGRVVVQFVVRADGKITNAKVVKGMGAACDAEALRVVNGMPLWRPGRMSGKPVAVYFMLPILFEQP